MHSRSTGLLSDSDNGVFHFLGRHQHQIRQLVNDDHDPGHGCHALIPPCQRIIAFYVSNLIVCQQLIPPLHLRHCPLQGTGGLFRICDHRDQQMGNPIVDTQLHHLRIDHNQAHLVRGGPIEQRHDNAVHTDRLTGAGGTGNQQMGHLGNIADNVVAANILTGRKGQRRGIFAECLRTQHLPDGDAGGDAVGHLNTDDGALSLYRRHTDAADAQRQRNVLVQRGDLTHFNARAKLHLIPGHGWASDNIFHLDVHIEAPQGLLQPHHIGAHLLGVVLLGAHCLREHGHRRVLIGRRCIYLGLGIRPGLDLLCHLLRRLCGLILCDLAVLLGRFCPSGNFGIRQHFRRGMVCLFSGQIQPAVLILLHIEGRRLRLSVLLGLPHQLLHLRRIVFRRQHIGLLLLRKLRFLSPLLFLLAAGSAEAFKERSAFLPVLFSDAAFLLRHIPRLPASHFQRRANTPSALPGHRYAFPFLSDRTSGRGRQDPQILHGHLLGQHYRLRLRLGQISLQLLSALFGPPMDQHRPIDAEGQKDRCQQQHQKDRKRSGLADGVDQPVGNQSGNHPSGGSGHAGPPQGWDQLFSGAKPCIGQQHMEHPAEEDNPAKQSRCSEPVGLMIPKHQQPCHHTQRKGQQIIAVAKNPPHQLFQGIQRYRMDPQHTQKQKQRQKYQNHTCDHPVPQLGLGPPLLHFLHRVHSPACGLLPLGSFFLPLGRLFCGCFFRHWIPTLLSSQE